MFKRIVHMGLIVNSIDRALPFYRDVFGMRVKADFGLQTGPEVPEIMGLPEAQVRIVMLELEGQLVELIEIVQPKREPIHGDTPYGEVGHSHLAFQVDDVDAAYRYLQERGVEMVIPPQEIPEQKFFYLRDPDNQWVEVVEPLGAFRTS